MSSARAPTVGAYVAAPLFGTAAVVATALMFPGHPLVALVGLAFVALATASARVSIFVDLVPVIVLLGLAVTAAAGRLPIPAAAGIGVLLLGYVLAADLAEATEHRGGMSSSALVGWLRGTVVLLAAGTGGALVTAVIVASGWDVGPALIVAAPLALLGAVVVALGQLHRRPGAGRTADGRPATGEVGDRPGLFRIPRRRRPGDA